MICVDTNLLIFGVQRNSNPQHAGEVEAAAYFLESLKDEDILVPPIAVTEYLMGFSDTEERNAQYEELAQRFFIPSFDAHCAKIAADIGATIASMKDLREATGLSRQEIKADIQIIATAIAYESPTLITHNLSEYQKILQAANLSSRIKVKWLTPVSQPRLINIEPEMLN